MEELIERLNGWLLESDSFDWDNGRFLNRSEALRRLDWHNNTHYRGKLEQLEQYIYEQHNNNNNKW